MRVEHQLSFLTFLRTLKNYVANPGKAIMLERREWGRWLGQTRLRQLGYARFFDKQPPWAMPPDCADLWNIYSLIRKRTPKLVYEFGSGCSTIVIAQALKDNAATVGGVGGVVQGRLVSIDDSEYWLGQTRSYLPAHLLSFVSYQACPLRVDGKVVYYDNVPKGAPDFVYMDGPNFPAGVSVTGNAADLAPPFILFDGRGKTVDWTHEKLGAGYRRGESRVHYWRWLERT